MNWQTVILDLKRSGLNALEIAAHVQCSNSYIGYLLHGKRKEPTWDLGERLLALLRKRRRYIK